MKRKVFLIYRLFYKNEIISIIGNELGIKAIVDYKPLQKGDMEEPCADISVTIRHCLEQLGSNARVAVLPQGPLTIPYLATGM